MNQQLSGIVKSIRYLRSTLSIVALVFLLLCVIFFGILFSPLVLTAKYILFCVIILLGIGVWCSFWRKAKTEPLTVTEQYWIAALPYAYGSNQGEKTMEELLELPKDTGTPDVVPPSKTILMLKEKDNN